MSLKALTALISVATACSVLAAPDTRQIDLNGIWSFKFERGRSLESLGDLPAFESDDLMQVPGCWDAMTRYYNQRGTGCYRRTFTLDRDVADAFLVVEGFCLRARFWLDGRPIGSSALPWSRVEFKTGAMKAGRHELVAAVDSIVDNGKVKLFWDFYDFYASGGFQHGMHLDLPPVPDALRRIVVRTRDYRTGRIELTVERAAPGAADFTADVSFDGGAVRRVDFRGGSAALEVPDFRLWSPARPNLHTVTVSDGRSEASARFGIRQVSTGGGRILLNGEPVYLKGVNRHEAHFEFGTATPRQLMFEDLHNLRELGGNFVRGSHYPQCEEFLTLCDELGILVWEESLGWGNRARQLDDPEFCDLQVEQTRLMVRNSINHPSVIISAFLNEPDSDLPACKRLVDRLIDTIRAEDSGHLVTFACHRNTADICHERTDLIAYNTYPCWYGYTLENGSEEEMRANVRRCHDDVIRYFKTKYGGERPIIISETGVKSDYGARDPRGKAQYTEDFQAQYERIMLEEIFARPEISGIAIWQFTDAKTYTRVGQGMINRSYGVNTGGLYDLYRRPKLVVEEVRRQFQRK